MINHNNVLAQQLQVSVCVFVAVKDSRGGLEFKDFKLCGKTNLRKSGEPNKPQTFIYSIKIGDWLMLRTWSLLFVNYITKPARITGNTQLSSV